MGELNDYDCKSHASFSPNYCTRRLFEIISHTARVEERRDLERLITEGGVREASVERLRSFHPPDQKYSGASAQLNVFVVPQVACGNSNARQALPHFSTTSISSSFPLPAADFGAMP